MARGSIEELPMPDHPVLRQVAEEMERLERVAQIVDHKWRFVYISSELWRIGNEGKVVAGAYGTSHIVREQMLASMSRISTESAARWFEVNAPYMRFSLSPDDPEFTEVFSYSAGAAAKIAPKEPPPVWGVQTDFVGPDVNYSTAQQLVGFRINDDAGRLVGVLEVSWPALPGAVLGMLSRGDAGMYERMARMADPHRCPTAILFCDIESSGELSRRLSSKAYFDLIRQFTTGFDEAVIDHGGIVGKHAGDGGTGFFCRVDLGSESAACRAAIETARSVRAYSASIDAEGGAIAVNCGVHWGGTVFMGQLVTGSRLEITALGDEVTEAARIEHAAKGGIALASKELLERLEPDDASALGLDLGAISYRTISSLEGAGEKAVRDAGPIAVAEV